MIASRKLRRKKKKTTKWIVTKTSTFVSSDQSSGSPPNIMSSCVAHEVWKSAKSAREAPKIQVHNRAKSKYNSMKMMAK